VNARHAWVDEECRRLSVWVALQGAAHRAALAGKSFTRSFGQLKRYRLVIEGRNDRESLQSRQVKVFMRD